MAKKGYGQFCPLAKASEVVAERWTLLVLRELFSGSHRFNDLRRGVPLMSPSLLSQRLKELESGGVIRKTKAKKGPGYEYHLTEAGRELWPIIEGLGAWGSKYAQKEIDRSDLDPSLLMWDVRRRVDGSVMPQDGKTAVEFDVTGVPAKWSRWWLVFDAGEVDLCLKDPGHEVALRVRSDIRSLTESWTGHLNLERALRSKRIELEGSRAQIRLFPKWFRLGHFAPMTRSV